MKKNSRFLLSLLFSPLFFSATGQNDYTSEAFDLYKRELFVNAGNDTLPYRILFPEGYVNSKETPYPLVIFLHGAGERGKDNAFQLAWGADLFLKEEVRKKHPAIVVFPQCPKGDYWAKIKYRGNKKVGKRFKFKLNPGRPGPSFRMAHGLIQKLIREEAVDVKRIYIGGLSMGGMGTFEMLARFPGKFAAAIPICGGGNPNHTIHYAKKTSLWIFHGSEDPIIGARHSRRMAKQLKKFKGDVRYSEYKGVGHDSWKNAFAEPELFEWLFSKKL